MLPDRVSNPGPLTYESGALPIALRGPAEEVVDNLLITGRIVGNYANGIIDDPADSLCYHITLKY